jgi:DNA-binding transcriptional LysR family regulator
MPVSWSISLIYRRDREQSVVFTTFLEWLARRMGGA